MSYAHRALGTPFTSHSREITITPLAMPIFTPFETVAPLPFPIPEGLNEADVRHLVAVFLTAHSTNVETIDDAIGYAFKRLGAEHDYAWERQIRGLNVIAVVEDASTNSPDFTRIADGLDTYLGREEGRHLPYSEFIWDSVVHCYTVHARAGKLRGFLLHNPAATRQLAAAILPWLG